jgi:hypothetical protein
LIDLLVQGSYYQFVKSNVGLAVVAGALALSAPTFAQGWAQINFYNRNLLDTSGVLTGTPGTYYDAPIPRFIGYDLTAGLFWKSSDGTLLTLAFSSVRSDGTFIPQVVDIPPLDAQTVPGGNATFLIGLGRLNGNHMENPIDFSDPFTVSNLGGVPHDGTPPIVPPNLNGFSFGLVIPRVPEPSSVAILGSGAALYLVVVFRKRDRH